MQSFRRFLKSKGRREVTDSTDQIFTQDLSKETLMDCDNENCGKSMDEEVSSETWSVSRESCDSEVAVHKTVSFSNVVLVCIVPSRKDLAPMWNDLWWSFEECDHSKKQADWELKIHSTEHGCDFKESIRALYQPDIESLRIDEESQHQAKILYGVYNKHKFRAKLRSSQSNSNTNTYSRTTLPSSQSQSLSRSQTSFTLSTPATSSDDGSSNSRSSAGTNSVSSDPTTPSTSNGIPKNSRTSVPVFTTPLVKNIVVDTTSKVKSRNQSRDTRNFIKGSSLRRLNQQGYDNNNYHTQMDTNGYNSHHENNNYYSNQNNNSNNGYNHNNNYIHDGNNHNHGSNHNHGNNHNQLSRSSNSNYRHQHQNFMNNSNHYSSVTSDSYSASLYGNLGIMGATSSTKGLRK